MNTKILFIALSLFVSIYTGVVIAENEKNYPACQPVFLDNADANTYVDFDDQNDSSLVNKPLRPHKTSLLSLLNSCVCIVPDRINCHGIRAPPSF
jgi:hypothetical protein